MGPELPKGLAKAGSPASRRTTHVTFNGQTARWARQEKRQRAACPRAAERPPPAPVPSSSPPPWIPGVSGRPAPSPEEAYPSLAPAALAKGRPDMTLSFSSLRSCVGSSVHGRCNLKSTRRRPVTLSAVASPPGRPLPCEPARPQVAANNGPFPCRSAHDEPVSFAVQLKCPLCCEGFSVSVVGTHFQFHLFTYLFICLFINLPPPPVAMISIFLDA